MGKEERGEHDDNEDTVSTVPPENKYQVDFSRKSTFVGSSVQDGRNDVMRLLLGAF
jgi:hypothetical protein